MHQHAIECAGHFGDGLRPFRRVIPPIGGVDLSPLALLLVLQIALFVVAGLRNSVLPMMLVG